MAQAAATASAEVCAQSRAGALSEAESHAHAKLVIQVDRICAMVGGCEELVTAAEERAGQLAARFHRESFRMLPHIDSPAVLIKRLATSKGDAEA